MAHPTKHICAYLIVLHIFILSSPSLQAKIYTWRDEKGVVHYNDKKIATTNASEVELKLPASDWKRIEIEITTVDAEVSDKEKQRIEDDINMVYRFYDKKLYFDIYKTVPVKMTILPNKKRYQAFIKKKASVTTSSYGVYLPKFNEIVVYIQKNRERTFRTIKHETSHAIVDALTPFVPAWLNEGIAENMEYFSVADNQMTIAPHPENYKSLIAHAKNKTLMPIDDFMLLTSSKWRHNSQKGIQYSRQIQAGELIRMLLSSPMGVSFVSRIMHNYKNGDRTFTAHLVEKHYFGGLYGLKTKWSYWIKRKEQATIEL